MIEKRFTITEAAHAIGVSSKALRNWCDRGRFDLAGERPANGWRTFSQHDVWVLAIAAELINVGADVEPAVEQVRLSLGGVDPAQPNTIPATMKFARVDGTWIGQDNGVWGLPSDPLTVVAVAARQVIARAQRHLAAVGALDA